MASALVLSYNPRKRNHSSAFLSGADDDDSLQRHYKRTCHVATGFSPSSTTISQFRGLAVNTKKSKSLEEVLLIHSKGSKCSKGDEADVCQTAKGEFPRDGPGWVDCFVREMATSSDMNVAKLHAYKLIEQYKKFLMDRASPESFKENKVVKDKLKDCEANTRKLEEKNRLLAMRLMVGWENIAEVESQKLRRFM